jgi:TATA-box binding protein (TBP) (component of TFIID and TFIIIB)
MSRPLPVFYTLGHPKVTFAIFASGRVASWGGQDIHYVRKNYLKFLKKVAPLGLDRSKISAPHIRMIVATVDYGDRLDLENLSHRLHGSKYEPERFPGLIWRRPEHLAVLLFRSGKCIITGASSHKLLRATFDEISRELGAR